MRKFSDYFMDSVDYPDDFAINPVLIGILYNYVSSTLLNGFINYVKPIKAFVLSRYHKWNEEIDHIISIQDPPGSCNWIKKVCNTKNELYNTLIIPEIIFHSKCDQEFNDDVVILAKAGNIKTDKINLTCYYYFYYDLDCSDCSIGRFVSDDNEQDIIKSFTTYINNNLTKDKDNMPREIPLHYFRGWISG